MKNIKIACLALLFICSAALIPPAKAGISEKKIVWTFYSSAYDMTVDYNPGAGSITAVYWTGHDVTERGASTGTVSYDPVMDELNLQDYQIKADCEWFGVWGHFERIN